MGKARLGVDVGGTFTDLVALVDGEVVTAKVASTADQSEAVLAAVEATGVAPGDVAEFAHGTTVATNALLERRGGRAALVTTDGFRDVIEIGRQNRPSLYDLTRDRPPPLVPRELRFTVRERVGPDGEIEPLHEEDVEQIARRLRNDKVESIAICFLFSYLHPEHERRVGKILRQSLPGVRVSLSSEVLPEFREYERFSTTVADAYLAPRLSEYLMRLSERCEAAGLPSPLVMQSSGGVLDVSGAAGRAAASVLSGPAAGAVGASMVAASSGFNDALSFDMGGTSTDVAPIANGKVATTTEGRVSGIPIRFPMADVHTVGAGGGSIAWMDSGGALHVGPRSAAADPGPACYGRGGAEATVTDADLYLGFMADGAVLGGTISLDRSLAEVSLDRLGERMNMDAEDAARGIAELVEAEMTRALRVISVERGYDPRGMALVAFGGAGPMHSCALAEALEMRTVLVPRAGGVLSALGLAASDMRRDFQAPFLGTLADVTPGDLDAAYAELERTALAEMPRGSCSRAADLRYAGQSFELTVDAADLAHLHGRFHDAHERRYGYRMESEAVQIINLRVTAIVGADVPERKEPVGQAEAQPAGRSVLFDGEWLEVDVWSRPALDRGSKVEGPCIVELEEATCVVRPGWAGIIDPLGTLALEAT
jgi:N-methylhydantoinase A